ncbi:hypothetical protein FLX35_06185 [Cylindrospermopsis raciborskii LB2897]|nr:hypothetical protein [Cylindrospermopsis raciborskii LB2897]
MIHHLLKEKSGDRLLKIFPLVIHHPVQVQRPNKTSRLKSALACQAYTSKAKKDFTQFKNKT